MEDIKDNEDPKERWVCGECEAKTPGFSLPDGWYMIAPELSLAVCPECLKKELK